MNRRSFLKGVSLSGALLHPFVRQLDLEAAGVARAKFPQRFVFVMKSSGIIPDAVEPPALDRQDVASLTSTPLEKLELPSTLQALTPFKDRLGILQGVSGLMCKGGHSSWFGALGVYKTGGEHDSGVILRATTDAELARLYPAPFQHVGLALRGKVMGKESEGTLYPGISAAGPGREIPFQASPDVAFEQLFGSAVAGGGTAKTRYELQSNLLDFMVGDLGKLQRSLPGPERDKLNRYTHAFEELRVRRERLAEMTDRIREHAPALDERFTSKTPEDRQEAHFDLIAAALLSGITNVVTMRLDNISTNYPRLGLSDKNVHGIGHGEVCNGKEPAEARDIIRRHHMDLLAGLAAKLDAMPEGDGTVLDNTTIVYMSDSGNEHHGNLREWPFLFLGGCGGRIKIPGHHIRVPAHGKNGHATIGNLYTTLLNAHGNPVPHYGNLDLGLKKNGVPQEGPISALL